MDNPDDVPADQAESAAVEEEKAESTSVAIPYESKRDIDENRVEPAETASEKINDDSEEVKEKEIEAPAPVVVPDESKMEVDENIGKPVEGAESNSQEVNDDSEESAEFSIDEGEAVYEKPEVVASASIESSETQNIASAVENKSLEDPPVEPVTVSDEAKNQPLSLPPQQIENPIPQNTPTTGKPTTQDRSASVPAEKFTVPENKEPEIHPFAFPHPEQIPAKVDANIRKRAYSDVRDMEEVGRRRSTREHKRPKFDDEFVYESLTGPSKKRGSVSSSQHERQQSVSSTTSENAQKDSEAEKTRSSEEKTTHTTDASTSKNVPKPPPTPSHHVLRSRVPPPQPPPNKDEKHESMEEREKRLRIPSKDSMLKEIIHGQEMVTEAASDILQLWPAVDDVALITAVTHVASIEAVVECVQFTRDYDLTEVQDRWYRLLYDEKMARSAKKRISEMTPEQVLFIQARTPFLKREEECLKRGVEEIMSAKHSVELADFANILQQYRPQFHSARTPQILSDHYRRMKLCRMALYKPPDWERIETATNLTNDYSFDYQRPVRSVQNRQRVMMDKPALVNPLIGFGQEKLPNNALAVLKGRFIRYTVISDYVLIGRSTLREKVDVDLSIEGPAVKVSRRQALLEYDRNENKFRLKNVGNRSIFVDGKPVPTSMTVVLKDQSIIEVCALRLVFKVTAATEITPRMKQALQYLKTNQLNQKLHIPSNLLQQQQQQKQQRNREIQAKHDQVLQQKQKLMQIQRSQDEARRRQHIQNLKQNPAFQQQLANTPMQMGEEKEAGITNITRNNE